MIQGERENLIGTFNWSELRSKQCGHSLTKFFTKQKRKHPCVEIKYDLIEHIIGGDTPCFPFLYPGKK